MGFTIAPLEDSVRNLYRELHIYHSKVMAGMNFQCVLQHLDISPRKWWWSNQVVDLYKESRN